MIPKALSYTFDYLSFLFLEQKVSVIIRAVYLFGSAVRGEMTKQSDIDIFLDCDIKNEKEVRTLAQVALKLFASSKDFNKWKQFTFTPDISFHTGPLDEWELKTSIGSEGIQLYGTPGLQAYERHILFTVELPKDHNAYLRLTRALFGRTEPGISAKGLVYDCDGKKISPASFTIPLSTRKKITDFLKEKKIHYSMQEVAFLA